MMRLLAAGLLVVLIDVRLNGFDLAPDVVGWGMAAVALFELATGSTPLRRAWYAAMAGVAVSATVFASFFSETTLPVLATVLRLAIAAIWPLFCWFLLEGLAHRASGVEPGAAGQARRLARVLAASLGILWLLSVADAIMGVHAGGYPWPAATPLRQVAMVAALPALVGLASLVLFLLRNAQRVWVERGSDEQAPAPAAV